MLWNNRRESHKYCFIVKVKERSNTFHLHAKDICICRLIILLQLSLKALGNELEISADLFFSAPDRASLILSPSKGYQVSAWSFKTGGPKQAFVIDGRSVYFIYYQHGDKWQFWIDVQVCAGETPSRRLI